MGGLEITLFLWLCMLWLREKQRDDEKVWTYHVSSDCHIPKWSVTEIAYRFPICLWRVVTDRMNKSSLGRQHTHTTIHLDDISQGNQWHSNKTDEMSALRNNQTAMFSTFKSSPCSSLASSSAAGLSSSCTASGREGSCTANSDIPVRHLDTHGVWYWLSALFNL